MAVLDHAFSSRLGGEEEEEREKSSLVAIKKIVCVENFKTITVLSSIILFFSMLLALFCLILQICLFSFLFI